MSLTRLGWACFFLTGLTAMSAASTGNNLLYLLLACQAAVFIVSWPVGRRNLSRLTVSARWPERIFQGEEFPLALVISNGGRPVSLAVSAAGPRGSAFVEVISAGGSAEAVLRAVLPQRGLNRVDDLILCSPFPLGLILHRRVLNNLEAVAFPHLTLIHSPAEISSDIELTGLAVPRKGTGDELYGIRPSDSSDGLRAVNWKLSAKTGRLMVNEYGANSAAKLTVGLKSIGEGSSGERRISEAASAVRYHLDAGAEVRLVTPEGAVDFGKGLLQLDRCLNALARLGSGKTARSTGASVRPESPGLVDSPALRRLLFLGIFSVASAMLFIDEINPKTLAYFLPVVALGWLLHEFKGPRLHPRLWDAASLGMLFFLLLFDWKLSGVAIANTHLIIYLLANRSLCEMKKSELLGAFLIVFLAFFLVSGLTISPWYFAFWLLYGAFAGAWLMTAQGLSWSRLRIWAPSWAVLSAAGLVLAAFLFVLTPRVDRFRRLNPFVAMGIDKLQVKSSSAVGFTEGVRLGFFGSLKKSTARVMKIKPDVVASGTPAPLRVRGAAYDRFDGRSWSRSEVDFDYSYGARQHLRSIKNRAWTMREGERMILPSDGRGPSGPVLEFLFYPINLSVLFTVGAAQAVEGTGAAAYFDFTDSVFFAAPYTSGVKYRLSHRSEGLGFSSAIVGYDRILRERFLQLPEGLDPRIRELALKITRVASDDLAKAKAVEAYLRRNYYYSAQSEAKDRTLSDFLFSARKGNCEYFATASVVLLRAAGVPARLATGFLAEEFNEFGKFYDVRQNSAHAWSEAYARGRGWETLEPTPSQGFFIPDAWSRRVERLMDAVELTWYRNVIGYDQNSQRNTFHRLGMGLSPDHLWRRCKPLLRGAASACAGVGLLWLLVRLLSPRRRPQGFYPRAEQALSRAGLLRLPHQTPREYAHEIVVRRPELKGFSALVELHYLERYCPQGLSPREGLEADRLAVELCSRL